VAHGESLERQVDVDVKARPGALSQARGVALQLGDLLALAAVAAVGGAEAQLEGGSLERGGLISEGFSGHVRSLAGEGLAGCDYRIGRGGIWLTV
jgi:hypothetical protein